MRTEVTPPTSTAAENRATDSLEAREYRKRRAIQKLRAWREQYGDLFVSQSEALVGANGTLTPQQESDWAFSRVFYDIDDIDRPAEDYE